jgi:hypothetical protein
LKRKRRATISVVLCVAALGVVITVVSTSGASAQSPAADEAAARAEVQNVSALSSEETSVIYAQAMRAAEQASDPAPEAIELTVTTMGAATELLEGSNQPANNTITDPRTGEPWADSAVYVVAMRGNFVLSNVSVRKGAEAPRGADLTLLIDRQLDKIVGVHVSDASNSLQSLGTPVTAWGAQS